MKTRRPVFNPLEPELFFFLILTHPVYNVNNTGTKQVSIMIQMHFEEKKTESIEQV